MMSAAQILYFILNDSRILDTILNRLAQYIEKTMNLKKRVKGAMVYPAAVLFVALMVIGSLLLFVIPVFQKMFADMGGTLPAFTQLVMISEPLISTFSPGAAVPQMGTGTPCCRTMCALMTGGSFTSALAEGQYAVW